MGLSTVNSSLLECGLSVNLLWVIFVRQKVVFRVTECPHLLAIFMMMICTRNSAFECFSKVILDSVDSQVKDIVRGTFTVASDLNRKHKFLILRSCFCL